MKLTFAGKICALFVRDAYEKKKCRADCYRDFGVIRQKMNVEKKDIIIILLLLAFLVKTFFFTVAFIDGNSMYPTLQNQEVVMVREFHYIPSRGDIALIRLPTNTIGGKYIVKRIIAFSGDTVKIDYEKNLRKC